MIKYYSRHFENFESFAQSSLIYCHVLTSEQILFEYQVKRHLLLNSPLLMHPELVDLYHFEGFHPHHHLSFRYLT